MVMPKHYCTKEAVTIIKEGSALLDLPGEKILKKGDVFIIPAQTPHSFNRFIFLRQSKHTY